MPEKKTEPRHFRSGRPPYDPLDLYLHVEAGRLAAGMSVRAYVHQHYLRVFQAGSGGRELPPISGEGLRRAYYRARQALLGFGEQMPAEVERLVAERRAMI